MSISFSYKPVVWFCVILYRRLCRAESIRVSLDDITYWQNETYWLNIIYDIRKSTVNKVQSCQ